MALTPNEYWKKRYQILRNQTSRAKDSERWKVFDREYRKFKKRVAIERKPTNEG